MPGGSGRLRVLLADDHVILRQGLKAILQEQGFQIVAEASDGHAVVRMCATLRPDLAIVDIAMPLLNGIDAAREVLKQPNKPKIVVLTMYGEESHVLASLRAGITGYVLKSSAASSLVEAIEAVVRDEIYLSPGVSRTLVQAYLSNVRAASDPLSLREREVLQLIAEGKNVKEIGGVLGISARTAETHRGRIMCKLDVHDIAGLVRYALKQGLINLEQKPDREEFSASTASPSVRADM